MVGQGQDLLLQISRARGNSVTEFLDVSRMVPGTHDKRMRVAAAHRPTVLRPAKFGCDAGIDLVETVAERLGIEQARE